jgi:prolipoprotein diacylglyceryltransferase
MEQVAYIVGETFLYWSSIILTLAAVCAMGIFLWLYLRKKGNGVAAAFLVPASAALSLVCARFMDWYCRSDSYESFYQAMSDYTGGDFALMGVFGGCLLAAGLLRRARIVRDLPEVYDCMAIAGVAGIGVGRLASLFNDSNRGVVIEGIRSLPLVYPVTNSVSGELEYRLATFMLQAIAAAGIFTVLLIFYLIPRKKRELRSGDTALLFLSVYGASQAVLDSTRYDSLFMRSNGFVSFVQVLGAVGLVIPIVVFSVRMVKKLKWRWWFLGFWIPMAAAIGTAGFMEYYVQRHGDKALFAYTVMAGCLAAVVLMTAVIRAVWVFGNSPKTIVETDNE